MLIPSGVLQPICWDFAANCIKAYSNNSFRLHCFLSIRFDVSYSTQGNYRNRTIQIGDWLWRMIQSNISSSLVRCILRKNRHFVDDFYTNSVN